MRHFEELARFEREGFDIVVEKTWEDSHPRDCFDEECYNIRDLCDKISIGDLDWFMLRVSVQLKGRPMAEEYLGACLYEDAREVLTDGTVEDLIAEALPRARQEAEYFAGLLRGLLDKSGLVPV